MDKNHPHKESQKLPTIGITLGDTNGIGPEVTLKALADNRIMKLCKPVVYANSSLINKWKKLLNLDEFQWQVVDSPAHKPERKTLLITSYDQDFELKQGQPTPESGLAAFKSLEKAVADLKSGQLDALVTGPISKANMPKDLFPYPGHTEYLEKELGGKALMLMVYEDLRIATATGHVALKDVPAKLNSELLHQKLQILEQTLKTDFKIAKPKIAVLGLNPHAGEDGKLGQEELEIIIPAIKEWKSKNKLVFGPYPADGFFGARQEKKFDAVLAMYHDQALIPFKALAFDGGVNYTAGLNMVRTSPDHGTAFALAGKNQANPDAFRNALFAALEIIQNREEHTQSAKPKATV